MKRNFLLWMMTVLAAAFALVSCDEKNGPDAVEPVFPSAITEALEPGESYTLVIEPNIDWIVELKYDSDATGWFWIQDGNSKAYTVRGKADEKTSIEVCAGDQTDFDKVRSCTLELTMGGKTQTIATFTRGTVARTFTLAYCKAEDGENDYFFNDHGDYEYNDPVIGDNPIPLMWVVRTGGDFRRNVKVTANFDWHLKSRSEWLKPFQGGKAGEEITFELEGDPMFYPLEDAIGDIVLCAANNPEATFTYKVQIPGCKDIFSITGFSAETDANDAGEIFVNDLTGEGSFADAETGVTGTVMGVGNLKIYTFAYILDSPFATTRIWDNNPEYTEWINVALGEAGAEDGVIKERPLTISVSPNDGNEQRIACVIAIPEDKAPESDYAFFNEDQSIADEYKDYVVTILTQAAFGEEIGGGQSGIEPITFRYEYAWADSYGEDARIATLEEVTEENIEELANKYAKYDKLNIFDYCPSSISATYILTYYSSIQNMTQLSIPDYDPTLETVSLSYYPKNEWLSYEEVENELSIWMDKPGADATQNFGIVQLFISTQRSYTIICLPEL